MRVSRRALRMLQRGGAVAPEVPINLVPMIDILTVLVLYLLVGAIATHLAILQLNLPAPSTAPQDEKPPLSLTVVVRSDRLDVVAGGAPVRSIPNTPAGHNFDALGSLLVDIKKRAPQENSIVLLLEPEVNYDTLVKLMDTTRQLPADPDNPLRNPELFPNVSIGDAPALGPTPPPAGQGLPGAAPAPVEAPQP